MCFPFEKSGSNFESSSDESFFFHRLERLTHAHYRLSFEKLCRTVKKTEHGQYFSDYFRTFVAHLSKVINKKEKQSSCVISFFFLNRLKVTKNRFTTLVSNERFCDILVALFKSKQSPNIIERAAKILKEILVNVSHQNYEQFSACVDMAFSALYAYNYILELLHIANLLLR